ncbi:MAG TPA: hypothetical protein PLD57_18290, partial [Aggregatilineales bacterium]|nr:hypothetical protein [Aggregatilineales bacterium]
MTMLAGGIGWACVAMLAGGIGWACVTMLAGGIGWACVTMLGLGRGLRGDAGARPGPAWRCWPAASA